MATIMWPYGKYLDVIVVGANKELRRRANLKEKVEQWWQEQGWGLPPLPLDTSDMGIIFRQIATCRYEDLVFQSMAFRGGFQPIWLELNRDIFTEVSAEKRSLLNPMVVSGIGRKGGKQCRRVKLADVKQCEGKPLSEIKGLISWHHRQHKEIFRWPPRVDLSKWLPGKANDFYPAVLALAVAHGVIFEDYYGGESGDLLDKFVQGVFEPAWRCVVAQFGVPPLIVKLPWWKELGYYPDPTTDWQMHGIIPLEYL